VSRWDRQFFSTTRGQIVTLLRRTRQTVDDLASLLDLTDNAVRAHLSRLERDGLVQQRGMRRGERRPAVVYELTPEAESLFPKAYAPALARLLDAIQAQASPADVDRLLRDTGQRLASSAAPPDRDASSGGVRGGHASARPADSDASSAAARRGRAGAGPDNRDTAARLQLAADALAPLGGLAEVHRDDSGNLELRSVSCPLGELVPRHPELCKVAEAFVAEVSGLEVRERCQRDLPNEPPRCVFAAQV
jgi:predicted ArsR family transcriptional regulator